MSRCAKCGEPSSRLTYRMPDLKRGLCPRCDINPAPASPLVKFVGTGWTPKEYE